MMVKDLVPELLDEIREEFDQGVLDSSVIEALLAKLAKGKANYLDANDYAVELGEILSKALKGSVTASKLPDGKMYYNIAKRVLEGVLGANYEKISEYSGQVQEILNGEAKIRVAVQRPILNQDRIDGIINRLDSEPDFESVSWILGDPIVNFSQNIVDDFIKKNAGYHKKIGLNPTIERNSTGKCCTWCDSLVGSYLYGEEPKDFYRRHSNCRCTIDYHPKNGKQQNSWSKKWANEISDVVERRRQQNLDVRDNNRKVDMAEYKKVISALGAENAPISLAKFQDLKYNDIKKYERLIDKAYISEKFQSKSWLDKINIEKQARHIQSTSPSEKSYFYDHVDVNALYDEYKMTGVLKKNRHSVRGHREKVDLPDNLHIGIDGYTGKEVNSITIHYSKTGAHIIPTYYEK